MRAPKATGKPDDGCIYVVGQAGDRSSDLPATCTVPPKDNGQTANEVAYLLILKICSRPRTEGGHPPRLERIDKRPAVVLADAMQQQSDLAVVFDDIILFKVRH